MALLQRDLRWRARSGRSRQLVSKHATAPMGCAVSTLAPPGSHPEDEACRLLLRAACCDAMTHILLVPGLAHPGLACAPTAGQTSIQVRQAAAAHVRPAAAVLLHAVVARQHTTHACIAQRPQASSQAHARFMHSLIQHNLLLL